MPGGRAMKLKKKQNSNDTSVIPWNFSLGKDVYKKNDKY